MKIGYHAPLPPARTGVADYALLLLNGLRKVAEVEVNAKRADVHLYQLGNNGLHRAIYERALAQPGVILLHDAVLHHFLLGALSKAQYIDEFVYNYGEWMRGRAERLWDGRGRSGADADYFSYPMLRRIVERSLGVIVHNPKAASLVRRHLAKAEIYQLPHLSASPPSVEVEGLRLRAEWGIVPGELLVGLFGFLRESKRVLPCLRAIAACRAGGLPIKVLLAGQPASSDLDRALAQWTEVDWIIRRPYLPEEDFWRHASAVDLCLNLRYPAAGETSGMVIRLLGLGKPVVVTEGEEAEGYPAGSFLPVPPGPEEEEAIRAVLEWVADHRGEAERLGRVGAEYLREHHGVEKVSETCCNFLQRYVSLRI